MAFRRVDIAVYVYNLAVVLSGAAIVTSLGIRAPVGGLAVGIVVAAVWTLYVRYRLIDRLLEIEAIDD